MSSTKHDYSKSFYYLVKEIIDRNTNAAKPGYAGPVSSEAVLFGSNPSLAFPIRDVEKIQSHVNESNQLPEIEMFVNFCGLTGTSSPLPEFYSENVIYTEDRYSPSGKLLDMFCHRLISYLFRTVEARRHIDSCDMNNGDARSNNMFALLGMRSSDLTYQGDINWEKLLPFANVFRNRISNRRVIKKIIGSYFDIDAVNVTEFVKQHTKIPIEDRNYLGKKNTVIGRKLSIGSTVIQYDTCITITLNSLSYRSFRSFFPNSTNVKVLRKLVEIITNRPLVLYIELCIESLQIPNLVLANTDVFQLGYNCWLGKPQQKQFRISL